MEAVGGESAAGDVDAVATMAALAVLCSWAARPVAATAFVFFGGMINDTRLCLMNN